MVFAVWCRVPVVSRRLTLAELRCTTCCFEAVLLSFLHAGVSCQEACLFKGSAVLFICLAKGTCNTVTDGTGLAGEAAAANGNNYIVLIGSAEKLKGLTNDYLQGLKTEIAVDVLLVDGDVTLTRK